MVSGGARPVCGCAAARSYYQTWRWRPVADASAGPAAVESRPREFPLTPIQRILRVGICPIPHDNQRRLFEVREGLAPPSGPALARSSSITRPCAALPRVRTASGQSYAPAAAPFPRRSRPVRPVRERAIPPSNAIGGPGGRSRAGPRCGRSCFRPREPAPLLVAHHLGVDRVSWRSCWRVWRAPFSGRGGRRWRCRPAPLVGSGRCLRPRASSAGSSGGGFCRPRSQPVPPRPSTLPGGPDPIRSPTAPRRLDPERPAPSDESRAYASAWTSSSHSLPGPPRWTGFAARTDSKGTAATSRSARVSRTVGGHTGPVLSSERRAAARGPPCSRTSSGIPPRLAMACCTTPLLLPNGFTTWASSTSVRSIGGLLSAGAPSVLRTHAAGCTLEIDAAVFARPRLSARSGRRYRRETWRAAGRICEELRPEGPCLLRGRLPHLRRPLAKVDSGARRLRPD